MDEWRNVAKAAVIAAVATATAVLSGMAVLQRSDQDTQAILRLLRQVCRNTAPSDVVRLECDR